MLIGVHIKFAGAQIQFTCVQREFTGAQVKFTEVRESSLLLSQVILGVSYSTVEGLREVEFLICITLFCLKQDHCPRVQPQTRG